MANEVTVIPPLPQRQETGMKRSRFAKLIGLTDQTVLKWEKGIKQPNVIQQMRVDALRELVRKNPTILAATDETIIKELDKLITQPTPEMLKEKIRTRRQAYADVEDEEFYNRCFHGYQEEGESEGDAHMHAMNRVAEYHPGATVPYPEYNEKKREEHEAKARHQAKNLLESHGMLQLDSLNGAHWGALDMLSRWRESHLIELLHTTFDELISMKSSLIVKKEVLQGLTDLAWYAYNPDAQQALPYPGPDEEKLQKFLYLLHCQREGRDPNDVTLPDVR